MFLWTLKINPMSKFIFSITAAAASMFGQICQTEMKPEIKTEKTRTIADSLRVNRVDLLIENKKNQPS